MKQERTKNKFSNKRGFSILELVIAIFVLTIGITGALKLIVSTIRVSMDTRNSVIASGLAQEGVELVRNIRDNNMLYTLADLSRDPDGSFKTGLPGGVGASNCTTDVLSTGLSCPGNYPIYLHPTAFTYSHSSIAPNVATIFRRSIGITYKSETINGSLTPQLSGMDVKSTVWWNGSDTVPGAGTCNLANKCIEVLDYLPKRD